VRVVRLVAGFAVAGIVTLFVAPALLALAGLHPLAVHGGSMAPVLHTGDAVIVRPVPVRLLMVGDIVTLPGPERGNPTVTHRLIGRSRDGNAISVTTKGDASAGSERWSLDAEYHVGRMVFRVPALGRATDLLSLPLTRAALIGFILIMIVTTGGSERPTEQRPN
jgi:signal peptidase I